MSSISRFQSFEKNIPYVYLDWYNISHIYNRVITIYPTRVNYILFEYCKRV